MEKIKKKATETQYLPKSPLSTAQSTRSGNLLLAELQMLSRSPAGMGARLAGQQPHQAFPAS